jgi:hypothetical protein
LGIENEFLYVLTYKQAMASVGLSRISRAGGPLEEIATHTGLGDLKDMVVSGGAAYVVQGKRLIKLGPGPQGEAELLSGVSPSVAAVPDSVYVVRCDPGGVDDDLLRLPLDGAPPEIVTKIRRVPSKSCEYTDIAVDASEVVVADRPGQRIVAVSRADGQVRAVAEKVGFPSEITLDARFLTFLSSRGMHRVTRKTLEKKLILTSDQVYAPFSSLLLEGDDHWIADHLPYSDGDIVYRMGTDEAELTRFTRYHRKDPVYASGNDTGLLDFSVDDECVYLAQWKHGQPSRLVAMARP